MINKFFAYGILLCFTVLCLPRELVHSHHEHHLEKKSELSNSRFESPDCFLCDFSLNNYTVSIPFFNYSVSQLYIEESYIITGKLSNDFDDLLRYRGPPIS